MAVENKGENLLLLWFKWHFSETPNFLLSAWKNYILFALNYFSLPVLVRTFFAPWRKYKWKYPKGFDVGAFFNTLISNSFSRIIGAFMRLILIVFGAIFQIFVIVAGAVAFVCWIILPVLAIAGFLFILFYHGV